ncbi:MAG: leucine-rich repeat domain-containing protein [Lachnospiraceae bacterium]|nr:leucine-rich repeat domain-containing protein [Lachnospiraceae bacterium]
MNLWTKKIVVLAAMFFLFFQGTALCRAETADEKNAEYNYQFDAETGTLTFNGTGMLGSSEGVYMIDMGHYYDSRWREEINTDEVRKVVIGNGITGIYRLFFQYLKNLEVVEIGSGVREIQDYAFHHCPSIRSITLDPANTGLKVMHKGIYTADGKKLCLYPVADSDQPIIASGTKTIGPHVFAFSRMTEITIPASVTALSGALFWKCEYLKSVHFEKNSQCKRTEETHDEIGTFERCKKLQKIEFGEKFQQLTAYTFSECTGLKYIYFGKSFRGFKCSSKEDKTFYCDSYLRGVNQILFPALERIKISKNNAVYKTKNNVVFSKNGKILYYYPVCRKGKTYRVPDSVTNIASHAFVENQTLQSVHTGKNTETISYKAFASVKKLSKVTFGKKIKTLEECAFICCTRLKSAKNLARVKNLMNDALLWTQIYLVNWDITDLTEARVGQNLTLWVPKTKQKVQWKVISGKEKVKIVKQYPNGGRVKVKIKKKGRSKIQITSGKKKWICIIVGCDHR